MLDLYGMTEVIVSNYEYKLKHLLSVIVTRVFVLMHRCNGEVELGSKALDDVLYRAQLELFPEPLLVGKTVFPLFLNFILKNMCKRNGLLLRSALFCVASGLRFVSQPRHV